MNFLDANLTFEDITSKHYINNGHEYVNIGKDLSYDVLMPNLRYINNKIYFISKNPIKITINDNIEFKREQIFRNISLTGNLYCLSKNIKFKIIEEELDNGLKVNISIDKCSNIGKCDMQKIARVVEAFMLGIDLMDDIESDELIFDDEDITYFNENPDEYFDEYFDENLDEHLDFHLGEHLDEQLDEHLDEQLDEELIDPNLDKNI